MLSHLCSEWSFWSFLSKMSKLSIMLIMLFVITSDSSNQSDHFKILIIQWLFNHCCYIIAYEKILTSEIFYHHWWDSYVLAHLLWWFWCNIFNLKLNFACLWHKFHILILRILRLLDYLQNSHWCQCSC